MEGRDPKIRTTRVLWDIGLLLNDPYKRDRIDGCMLDIFRSISVC
jgi:hypothetical protein